MLTPVLVGFALAAIVIALGWRPWSGQVNKQDGLVVPQEGPASGPWLVAAGASAIALAVYIANGQGSLPPWPPHSWTASLWLALPLIPLAVLGGRHLPLGALAFAAWMGASLWFSLAPYRENQWKEESGLWTWLPGLVAGATLLYVALEGRAQRQARGWGGPWLLLVALTGAIKPVLDGGSSTAAMILVGECFLIGGLLVLALWRRDYPVLRGVAAPMAWIPFSMLFQGVFYAYLERIPALLLALAFLAVGLPGRHWSLGLLRFLLVSGLVAGATYLAWPEADPYGY